MSKQLDGVEPKDIIKTVTGRVTKLWDEKTFQSDRGEFIVQNGEIEIDGDKYKLKLISNTQDKSMAGKMVTLSSSRGKHGLNGVVFEHESYMKDGTKVEQDVIKVTKTGRVEWEGVESAKPAAKSASKKSIETIVNDTDPKKSLDQLVEMHMYIDSLTRHAYKSRMLNEDTVRSYVSTIFIEANKRGIVFASAPAPAEEPVDPKDWGSVIVPEGHPQFKEIGGKKLAEIGKPNLIKLHQYFLANPSDKPIARAVEQAAEDLQLGGAEEVEELEQDDIPW